MLQIRRACPLSWFHPDGARKLGARLAERLCKRMAKGGLFVTLTYDRTPFGSSAELYREQRDQRHVRRFIHRLESYLGAPGCLKGRWCRKMEFHKDGWVHWHVVLDWHKFIDVYALRDLWGHGSVSIAKATRGRCRYVAKYVAKTMDDLPPFLLGEPCRSVKIFAVSPGFWDPIGPVDGEAEGEGVLYDDVCPVDARAKRESLQRRAIPFYVTVGQAIERNRDCIEVVHWQFAFGEVEAQGYKFRLKISDVYQLSRMFGCELRRDEQGVWWMNPASVDDEYAIIKDLEGMDWARWGEGASIAVGDDAPSFSLSTSPDAPSEWLLRYWSDHPAFEWNHHTAESEGVEFRRAA